MAYYRGDYYRGGGRGDYYRGRRGDPFWGGLWSVIKGVGSALLGAPRMAAPTPTFPSTQFSGAELMAPMPNMARMPIVQRGARAMGMTTTRRAAPPATRGGSPGDQIVNINGKWYRQDFEGFLHSLSRRRMNPANPRALRRSIRRVVGFGRLAARSKRSIAKAATALGVNRGRSRRWSPPRRKAG